MEGVKILKEEEKEAYKPKLPPMPDTLAMRGVNNICSATLLHAIKDAARLEQYNGARNFAASAWCMQICETLDIDYPSYRNKVMDLAEACEELCEIIDAAADFKKYYQVMDDLESMAIENCKKIKLDYEKFKDRVLNRCMASATLNENIDKARSVDGWKAAFVFAGLDECKKLCRVIGIEYKQYQARIVDTCRRTSGEALKVKYEKTIRLYDMLDKKYLNNNIYGVSYHLHNRRDILTLFNMRTRKVVLFEVLADGIYIHVGKRKKENMICIKYIKDIYLSRDYVQITSEEKIYTLMLT